MTKQIVISIYMIIIVICMWLDLFIYCCWLIVFTSSHRIFCVFIFNSVLDFMYSLFYLFIMFVAGKYKKCSDFDILCSMEKQNHK